MLEQAGGAEEHNITEAAPSELAEGGQSEEAIGKAMASGGVRQGSFAKSRS